MTDSRSTLRGWLWVPSLYLAEGLPYVVVMTVAGIMFKRMGVSNAENAFYASLLGLPWALKLFWSPFVEMFSTRRHWIVAMQIAIAAALGLLAFCLPGAGWFRASVASFMAVGFLSATHDVAADGFYMLGLDTRGQSFFVGIRTTFYRLAMIAGQGPLVVLAGWLEVRYGDIPRAWAVVFFVLAAVMAAMALYHAVALPRPSTDRSQSVRTLREVGSEFVDTFTGFFTKRHIGVALLFILLYKLPEAQLLKLISPFLLDSPADGGLGLDTSQVGVVYGTIGVIGVMLGGIVGGILVARSGLHRWMMPMAWSMSLTCITFLWLSIVPAPSMPEIYGCVFVEQFGYGFGTTAYMLYLIHFARGARSTAYYAIATGIMSLGMILPGMAAGWIQQQIGYTPFFIWTMACCLATLGVAAMARKSLE